MAQVRDNSCFTLAGTMHMAPAKLLRLSVQGMLPATGTILLELDATRVVAPIFFGHVIAFLAIGACQGNYRAYVFFRSH
jgi:hypothetical protein